MSDIEQKKEQQLTALLQDAADEKPGAPEAFFEALLRAEVWVAQTTPAQADGTASGPHIIGQGNPEELGVITVSYEGHDCVPIFTEEAFVADWALKKVFTAKKPFKTLLWVLGEETWLYLNPNQEIGKEITAWEVKQMRKGADAIPDLVGALGDDGIPDMEVRSDSELYPKLKRKILPVLELCKNLDEAFMVAVKEDGSDTEKPMIGLKYNSKATSAEKNYIKEELRHVGTEDFADGSGSLLVVDDLGNSYSPNENIFSDSRPFYIAYKKEGPGQKIISSVTSLFRSKKETTSKSEDGKD
jgi:hypothetical protein